MAKKSKPQIFKFEGKHNKEDDTFINVRLAKSEDDQYGNLICTLYKQEENKWRIYDIHERSIPEITNYLFPTKEAAATFVASLLMEVERVRNVSPLPKSVQTYLVRRAQQLKENEKNLLSQFWQIRDEQYQLLKFARENKIGEVEWNTDHSDIELAVKKLLEFEVAIKGEDKPVPFFSETSLYKLIGKDDARTVRALLNALLEKVAPNIVPELL